MFDPVTSLLLIIAVVSFLVFITVYSIKVSLKTKTYEDYNVAGRNIPSAPLILTIIGTAVGGATVLGFTSSGYETGIGSAWEILPAYLVMVFVILFMLKVIRKIGTKHNMITIPDFTALRYGEKARLPSTIAVLFAYCAITGMQFTALATFLNVISGLSITAGIFAAWLILTSKVYLGGLKAVIWADYIQGTIQNLGIIILFIVLFVLVGGYAGAAERAIAMGEPELMNLFSKNFSEFLVFFLTLGAYQMIRQDAWQRIWAAKDAKIALKSFWIATIVSFIITFAIFYLGTFGRLLEINIEDPALTFYMISNAVLPTFGLVLVMTALIATIVSCADSNLIAASSTVVNDIIKPMLNHKKEKDLLQFSRFAVLITSIAALMLSLYIPRLIELWVTGTAMLISGLMFPVLAAFFWQRASNAGGLAAMWGGLIVAVIWQILGHPLGLHPVYLGLPVSFILLVVVSLITKPSPAEIVEPLLYINNKQG